MNEAFYRQTAQIEDRHWWFVHRRRLVRELLAAVAPVPDGARVLDVGCGSGGNLDLLAGSGAFAVGLDRSALALELARGRRPQAVLVRGDANRLADLFATEAFDAVGVFNVLYHRWVEDERRLLEQIRRVLAPGGLLVLTEPALRVLFRRHDVVDYGVRRYTLGRLRALVAGAGFRVLRGTYFNGVALAPALVRAGIERLSGGLREAAEEGERVRELELPPAWLNRGLGLVCAVERGWIRYLGRLPLGVGLLLLARRDA